MPGTLTDRINELSEEVSNLSGQTRTKDLKVKLANNSASIAELKSELTTLHKEFDDFKRSMCKQIEDLKRELISYIILSNASKELDTAKLSESARHLASGITPRSHVE